MIGAMVFTFRTIKILGRQVDSHLATMLLGGSVAAVTGTVAVAAGTASIVNKSVVNPMLEVTEKVVIEAADQTPIVSDVVDKLPVNGNNGSD